MWALRIKDGDGPSLSNLWLHLKIKENTFTGGGLNLTGNQKKHKYGIHINTFTVQCRHLGPHLGLLFVKNTHLPLDQQIPRGA